MLDLFLRELKEKILAVFVPLFVKVHPNTLTTVSLFFGILCNVAVLQGQYFVAHILWLLNRFFDGIDGVVARKTGRASNFGGYYDILSDFAIYCSLPIAIAVQQQGPQLALSCMLLEALYCLNAVGLFYLSALLEKVNLERKRAELTSVTFPAALVEGFETMVAYSAFLLWPAWCSTLFFVFGGGVAISIVQRLRWAFYHLP
uniref:CDP-alcohol phosphatidyltransferase n=1 Tax=Arcella intermedia TaxID=1963864 RepID=A0A6B2LJ51_9EUKA|eukprot:TRINITY_DN27241_c0_g1_i1.p1 TRINITY_DN27241_c0_g1~~TRINITY_DN27241_c0_g1_i1.p1  ORF type:complete len:202 (-),score=32.15 TRINITY_DN27241_c0_g1_i1:65-670(-)